MQGRVALNQLDESHAQNRAADQLSDAHRNGVERRQGRRGCAVREEEGDLERAHNDHVKNNRRQGCRNCQPFYADITQLVSQQAGQQAGQAAGAETMQAQIEAAHSRRLYKDFLRRFAVMREEPRLDPDEFDLGYYSYGLRTYGNLPLIEPLESRESKKIEELALVIDTSYSTSGELVRAFLAETYTLLKGRENFFHRMNLHLIQADNAIRQDILIHNEDELIHAMNHFELRGGGGTDFRPAFEYVNQLCAEKKFSNLRGLLYFTDGMGTYPARRPAYDTAFLFLGEKFDDANVPPWAMKVVLDEDEFSGSTARAASALADALAEEDDPYRELNNS